MKEKLHRNHSKKHDRESSKKKKHRRHTRSSSSSSSSSDQWVEKETEKKADTGERDDWMSMTGVIKTYTKDELKPREEKEKKHIDSYNPSTSSRELNPYWKDGGSGLPQKPDEFRKSRPFIKPTDDNSYYSHTSSQSRYKIPSDDDNYYSPSSSKSKLIRPNVDEDYYSRSSSSQEYKSSSRSSYDRKERKSRYKDDRDRHSNSSREKYDQHKRPYGWKKQSEKALNIDHPDDVYQDKERYLNEAKADPTPSLPPKQEKVKGVKYLSDEKMNKLAAKIVKAEIMGDNKLVDELKVKLEAAREYRKQNPNAREEEEDDDKVMLISTNSAGNSRPLSKGEGGDPRSKGGKRKAETHASGERTKYFGNDDKYDLAQMFQQEKYGNNYNDEAELARIAAKSKNPNDDLEDIFVDEISKNRNDAKDRESEKQRAINQHVRVEKSLEGCEHCLDSKNMLKHLMVSCGSKVYLALPARKSLVKNQCIITTIQHSTCITALDEDVWEEIMNYRKAITQFFNSQGQDVVFFETATRLHRFPHMVINCVPLPRDVGDMASIYFKKALLECEAEWSMNKKVVDLKGKNIRKGVPKGLPYFWIDFGMDPGFAHVIEDQQLFPKAFAEEIIAGILDLDHQSWKKPHKEYGDVQRKKVLEFLKEWKPFDTVSQNKV